MFILASTKPRLAQQAAKQKRCVTSQYRFPLLQSPLAAFFTPLHLTLGIIPGDMRLACSICADINARGSLELFSYGISIALAKYIHAYIYSVDSGKHENVQNEGTPFSFLI